MLDSSFIASLKLPMAAPPTQTAKLASAGIGLSPYQRPPGYNYSEPRHRSLWLEFAEPIADERDALFARVLAYAPDPMLTGLEPPSPPLPVEPTLPVPSESIRSIIPGQSQDSAGLDAMQPLISSDSPRHFYLPIPPGLSEESLELFGFFTYELRIGHFDGWSTARARFGPALRVTGIQHPAPPMVCEGARNSDGVLGSAVYATPVTEGRSLLPSSPKTEIWILLYVQVTQVDGADHRNVLLSRRRAEPMVPKSDARETFEIMGVVSWEQREIDLLLGALGLPRNTPLSILAVELLPQRDHKRDRKPDPLGGDLGSVRILRTSQLVPVPEVCL